MENSPVSLKAIVYTTIFAFAIVTFVMLKPHTFPKTFITVCDVGQGDAIYIRQSDGVDVLIDTGPNESVLECLGKSMMFADKHIDMVFISHPHLDHYGGLSYIFSQYEIGIVYMPPLSTKSVTFNKLITTIEEVSQLEVLSAGQMFAIGEGGSMEILWPSDQYLKRNSYAASISNHNVRFSSLNPNDFSLVQFYTYRDANVLFTGDISKDILLNILMQHGIRTVDILKVPHHGSDTGLNTEIFDIIMPEFAVISVGKKNRYSHPSPNIVEILSYRAIPTFLTADSGSISFDYKEGDWVQRQSCFLVFSC
ncbi:MBL fold metallo-hydrolase [Candidatus Woesebacteria bacterium]|nr:MBL fold metallo-hydrolase [Candidatus Woesebacteria bacterium]